MQIANKKTNMLQAKKNWIYVPEPNPQAVSALGEEFQANINPYFLRLLVSRKLNTLAAAKTFMVPTWEQLYDPFLMKDMDKAVERLNQALETGEKILIYGDYDVDGTTSVALVYSYLTLELGADCDYYIPDRYAEGYGVSQAGVQYAADNGYTLIISLDCGIKAHERVQWCNENGIDFIVCDHHLPEATLPEAYAVLDPKRKDCAYPFKELTGCGVGFKLLQGFIQENDLDMEPLIDRIDLLAASIAADMVPIIDENRVLAYFGLQKLGTNPSPGLGYLLQKANKKAPIQISDIVFSISPTINAAGRMDHAHGAVKLLLAADQTEASMMAEAVIQQNLDRRVVEKEIVQQALQLFEGNDFLQNAIPVSPSAILMDMRMPGKSGVEIQAEMLEHKWLTPIVFISGESLPAQIIQAMKQGAVDFLFKPFNLDELLAALTKAVDKDTENFKKISQSVSIRQRYELLTPREAEICALLVDGLMNKDIAVELGITNATIKVHKARVMEKMQADSLQDLVRYMAALSE